jgi:hypothetical protein
MPPPMDVNLAPEPRYVGLFGAEGRGPDPQLVPRHLEQPGWVRHAPYLPGKLGDISTAASQWNQRIASRSSRLSDACVQFHRPIWVVYL